MITFLCGTSGSGKSHEIAVSVLNDLRKGIPVILLVPEQMSLSAEKRITDLALSAAPAVPTDRLEILNFTRLANRVFRTEGGLSYQPIGVGGKTLIMWQALAECAPFLGEYRSALISPETTARLMLSAVQEFQMQNITPHMLTSASEELAAERPALSSKLKDLSLLFETYRHMLKEKYDDPLDELPRLCRILREKNLFEGYHIYCDSFNGLTAQEFDVMECLFRQAKQITFSVCITPEQRNLQAFSSVETMYRRLRRMAGEFKEIVLSKSKRFSSPALSHVCEKMWVGNGQFESADPIPPCGEAVRIFECTDRYSEAEQVALDISRKVREQGCRYRDFAIIAGDAAGYAGIIDSYLSRYHIPFFFSIREDMTQIPLIKLILTALAIKQYAWRCQDVTDLLKTGLTPLDENACDLLCDYADTWNINGARWTDADAWTMHPRGYLSEFREDDKTVLLKANEYRQSITLPLAVFFEEFHPGATVKEIASALYEFLISFGVRDRLIKLEEERAALIWNTLMAALDELVVIVGEMPVNAEQFSKLFATLIGETDIGRLPVSADEVVIGSASMLRAENVKHVYLLGANDGEFPAVSRENTIFSDDDKVALECVDIVLSSNSQQKNEEALFHFFRSATCASDSLTVLYSTSTLSGEVKKPSRAVERLFALFPDLSLTPRISQNDLSRLESPSADFSLLSVLGETELGIALKRYYKSKPEYADRLQSLQMSVCAPKETLSSEVTEMLYPGNLALSQSRLEDFVHCAFGYHCKHVLKLQETRPAVIRPTDTGVFVHHILDRFFRAIRTETGIRTDIEDDEMEALADRIIGEYLAEIFGGKNRTEQQSSRLLALFRRLKRSTMIVIQSLLEEFASSSFVPTFFELPISYATEENAIPPLSIRLEDGKNAYIIGRIDRVDTFKKGNDVYVRVVDYKTGSKTFSVKDLSLGLNMQMLLYLFAIWNNATPAVKEAMGIKTEGRVLPAGVLYCSAKPASLSLEYPLDNDMAQKELSGSMKRSGMLLYNEEILHAMDHSEGMRFLPIKFGKDGAPSSYTLRAETLQTLEGFGEKMRVLSKRVEEIAKEIRLGNCSALPLKEKSSQTDACRFCSMKAVCRNFKYAKSPQRTEKGVIDDA